MWHRCGRERHDGCCCPLPFPPFSQLVSFHPGAALGVMGWCGPRLGSASRVGGPVKAPVGGRQRLHPMLSHPLLSHPMLSHAGVMFPAPVDLIGQSCTWQLGSKVPISQTQTGRFINRKNIQSPSPSKACNLFYSRQPNFI